MNEPTHEVPAVELRALALELTDALGVLLAIATDALDQGDLELSGLVTQYLLHRDDETGHIDSLFARFPELREATDARAAEMLEAENEIDENCEAYPDCPCGTIEAQLAAGLDAGAQA